MYTDIQQTAQQKPSQLLLPSPKNMYTDIQQTAQQKPSQLLLLLPSPNKMYNFLKGWSHEIGKACRCTDFRQCCGAAMLRWPPRPGANIYDRAVNAGFT
jgi:hypothetical protein